VTKNACAWIRSRNKLGPLRLFGISGRNRSPMVRCGRERGHGTILVSASKYEVRNSDDHVARVDHASRVSPTKRFQNLRLDDSRCCVVPIFLRASLRRNLHFAITLVFCFQIAAALSAQSKAPVRHYARWTETEAATWQLSQPWPVGANFLPSSAGNQLEMWQAATWDPMTIDRELGFAESAGMNTMRVFLHDLLWSSDPQGFSTRIDEFLSIAAKHNIRPLFVLFDSCWNPSPSLGPQTQFQLGKHNSMWVQSPGRVMDDASQDNRLEAYVKGVVGRFASDDRILGWDLWNEPDNEGPGSHWPKEEPLHKNADVNRLLPLVFAWARSVGPIQPLTSGVFQGEHWDDPTNWTPAMRTQLTESDFISFHDYHWHETFEERVKSLQPLHRPILCTEYMARSIGSTFDDILPIAARYNVGAINWGLVQGRMQTFLPWESWEHPYIHSEPPVWFHDVFRADGTPYRTAETKLLRWLTRCKTSWVGMSMSCLAP
jgi:hypothetical protein